MILVYHYNIVLSYCALKILHFFQLKIILLDFLKEEFKNIYFLNFYYIFLNILSIKSFQE